MRLIVHPGFHKTGTTTVQSQLLAAQPLWEARAGGRWLVGLRDQMPGLAHTARLYSESGDALDLGMMQNALADWLEAQDWAGAEGAVISCEDYAGQMPGRGSRRDYSAAPALMRAFVEVAQSFFGGQVELAIHFSTRAPESWWPSVHWQNVRTGKLAESWETFSARMQGAEGLDATVAAVRQALGAVPVSAMALEESRTLPWGLITPLLDLMGLPEAERGLFEPEDRRNARPEHGGIDRIADRFAAINARFPDKTTAQRRKRALLARAAEPGQESKNDR